MKNILIKHLKCLSQHCSVLYGANNCSVSIVQFYKTDYISETAVILGYTMHYKLTLWGHVLQYIILIHNFHMLRHLH